MTNLSFSLVKFHKKYLTLFYLSLAESYFSIFLRIKSSRVFGLRYIYWSRKTTKISNALNIIIVYNGLNFMKTFIDERKKCESIFVLEKYGMGKTSLV